MPILELLLEWRNATPFGAPQDWVFASSHDNGKKPLWPGTLLQQHIEPVVVQLGLPHITWHSFRHSVSTWLQEAGVPLVQIKAALRHADIQTTQRYGKPKPRKLRKIQKQLTVYLRNNADESDPDDESGQG